MPRPRRATGLHLGLDKIQEVLAQQEDDDTPADPSSLLPRDVYDRRRGRFVDPAVERAFVQERQVASLSLLILLEAVMIFFTTVFIPIDYLFYETFGAARVAARVATFFVLVATIKIKKMMQRDHSLVTRFFELHAYVYMTVFVVPLNCMIVVDDVEHEVPAWNREHPDNQIDVRTYEPTVLITYIAGLLYWIFAAGVAPLTFIAKMYGVIMFEVLLIYLFWLESVETRRTLFYLGVMCVFVLCSVVLGIFRDKRERRAFYMRRSMDAETKQVKQALLVSDVLLRNVVPGVVADALKGATGTKLSRLFHNSSVVFVDFGSLSSNHVALFNSVICWLDEIAEQTAVEKVKSTSSGWMGVCGAPYDDDWRNVMLVVDFAVSVLHKLDATSFQTNSGKVELRLGIAQGTVVAGVLSTGRLKWDLFGDVVNLASRLSSNTAMGTIQVSEVAKANVERVAGTDRFFFEQRMVYLKGKGETTTYLLDPQSAIGSPDMTSSQLMGSIDLSAMSAVPSTPRTGTASIDVPSSVAGDDDWEQLARYSDDVVHLRRWLFWVFDDPDVEREFREDQHKQMEADFKTTMAMIGAAMLTSLVLEVLSDDTGQVALFAASRLGLGGVQVAAFFVGQQWPQRKRGAQRTGFLMLSIAFVVASVLKASEINEYDYSRMGYLLYCEFFLLPTFIGVVARDTVGVTAAIAWCVPFLGRILAGANLVTHVFNLVGILLAMSAYVFFIRTLISSFLLTRRIVVVKARVSRAHRRAETLLYRAFPAAVLDKLRDTGSVNVSYPSVSVVASDLVGFTALSSQLDPPTLVEFVEAVFRAFDAAAAELHVEVLKTLGDAWICCIGAPDPRDDHFATAIKLGLSLIAAVSQTEPPIKGARVGIRVGIATGSVIGSIVGKTRVGFDVFGGPPAAAAELEGSAMTNTVHVGAEDVAQARSLGYSVEKLPDGSGLVRPERVLL